MSAAVAREVLSELEGDGLVALEGLTGVWCFTAVAGGDLVLGNVILSR